MNINRNNYEEFFMQYADNELPAAEKKEVEAFIAANPDLRHELELFQQFKLTPDATVIFTGKETLMKAENVAENITSGNYEAFFVLYADDELTSGQKEMVENFVYHHPQLQAAFELLQQVKLYPDTNIGFKNKESLYRKEEDDKVIPFPWWKLAVAAMIVIIAGIFLFYQAKNIKIPATIVKNTAPVTNPQQPPLHNKEEKNSGDTNSNTQALKETMAATDGKDDKKDNSGKINPGSINPHIAGVSVDVVKKKIKQEPDELQQLQTPSIKEETVAANAGTELKGSNINSIVNQSSEEASINTGMAAAASKSVINQQLVYHNTGEDNKAIAQNAVVSNNDDLEVLNTSVNTKNSLRGFFRKASRLITKKANLGDEDGKRKSILIGGFEIAGR